MREKKTGEGTWGYTKREGGERKRREKREERRERERYIYICDIQDQFSFFFLAQTGVAPKEWRRRRAEKRLSQRVCLEGLFLLCPLKVWSSNI